jgi:hypothetical protein
MLQVKARGDTSRGTRFMATICFYQDTAHAKPLEWMQSVLGHGYLSNRKDGMTELRINGFIQVKETLIKLQPYLRFKQKQARALLAACTLLSSKTMRDLSVSELHVLVDLIFEIRNENYRSAKALTKNDLLKRLGLTP